MCFELGCTWRCYLEYILCKHCLRIDIPCCHCCFKCTYCCCKIISNQELKEGLLSVFSDVGTSKQLIKELEQLLDINALEWQNYSGSVYQSDIRNIQSFQLLVNYLRLKQQRKETLIPKRDIIQKASNIHTELMKDVISAQYFGTCFDNEIIWCCITEQQRIRYYADKFYVAFESKMDKYLNVEQKQKKAITN